MYTLDFYTLGSQRYCICSLEKMRAGELNEPVGFLVSSQIVRASYIFRQTLGTFHLSELADQARRFAKGMRKCENLVMC